MKYAVKDLAGKSEKFRYVAWDRYVMYCDEEDRFEGSRSECEELLAQAKEASVPSVNLVIVPVDQKDDGALDQCQVEYAVKICLHPTGTTWISTAPWGWYTSPARAEFKDRSDAVKLLRRVRRTVEPKHKACLVRITKKQKKQKKS